MSADTVADRRVHPATIPLRFLKEAPSTLLGLPAAYAFMSRPGIASVLAFAALIGVAALAYQWLAWTRFRYGIGEGELVIESGILSRNRRSIPFDRIQDVDIERGPLARLFGLARLRIETGGSARDEGVLDSVTLAEAERLRTALRLARQGVTSAGEAAEPERRPTLFEMGPSRLMVAGLLNVSLVWIGGIFALLETVGDWLPFDLEPSALWEERGDVVREQFSLGAAAALLLAIVVISLITGIARTFARDFGFRLSLESEGLRRQRGLFTRSEVLIPRERIQLAALETGPIRRLFGFSQLSFQTLSAGTGKAEAGPQRAAPLASPPEVDRILEAVKGYRRAEPDQLEMVSSRRILRRLITSGLAPLVVVGIAMILFSPFALLLPFVAFNLLIASVERRYRRFGIADGLLFVQAGVLGRSQSIVPLGRIQSLSLSRGFLQRRLGLATLAIDTAGAPVLGGVKIPDLHEDRARKLAEELSRHL